MFMRKGQKHTKEWKEEASKRMSGNKYAEGSIRTYEEKKRISKFFKGRVSPFKGKKHSQEVCEMISELHKGNKYNLGTHRLKETKVKIGNAQRGEKNKNWMGDFVGYHALHSWIQRKLGTPNYCEHCKKTDKLKYEWANKEHSYKRVVEDYIRLCTSCHRKYDYQFNSRKK